MSTKKGTTPPVTKILKGSPLQDFTFQQMLEISHTDDDGNKRQVIGLSANLDKDFANAFVDGPGHYRFDEVMVVTKEDRAYVLRETVAIPVLSEKEMIAKIREHALRKLSPAQQKALNL